jgi:hypothetical protein
MREITFALLDTSLMPRFARVPSQALGAAAIALPASNPASL